MRRPKSNLHPPFVHLEGVRVDRSRAPVFRHDNPSSAG